MFSVDRLRELPIGGSILIKGDPTKIMRRVASNKKLLLPPNFKFECQRYLAARSDGDTVIGFLLVEVTRIA